MSEQSLLLRVFGPSLFSENQIREMVLAGKSSGLLLPSVNLSRDDINLYKKASFEVPRPPRESKWTIVFAAAVGSISFGLYLIYFNIIRTISFWIFVVSAGFLLFERLRGSDFGQQTPPLVTKGLEETKAVDFANNGESICSRCNQTSSFEAITINEHGYFCKVCVNDILKAI